jgi:hypothetical protein
MIAGKTMRPGAVSADRHVSRTPVVDICRSRLGRSGTGRGTVVPSATGADRYTLTQLTVNGASGVAAVHSRCMRAQPGDMMGLEVLTDSVASLATWSKVVELNAIGDQAIRPVRLFDLGGRTFAAGATGHVAGPRGQPVLPHPAAGHRVGRCCGGSCSAPAQPYEQVAAIAGGGRRPSRHG